MFKSIQDSEGYHIKAVADLTGLSTHAIRKWEERYQLLRPARGSNHYRLYNEQDIQLLMYLQWQISKGQTIGQLASLGAPHLREAMNHSPIDLHSLAPETQPTALTLITAARQLDHRTIESTIHSIVHKLGLEDALHLALFPALRMLGDMWHQGHLCISGEHLVTHSIRRHLATALRNSNNVKCPVAIIACAPDNFHEIGAMTAAFLLQKNGWNAVYLGVNSDIDVIRLACERRQGKLIILSIVLERSENDFSHMVKHIKEKLLGLCPVMIGGRGASNFSSLLEEQGIAYIESIHQLRNLEP